jgi:hypothetical protein
MRPHRRGFLRRRPERGAAHEAVPDALTFRTPVAQEVLLAEHPLGIGGERDEELVLLRRELDGLAADADDARGEVDLEVLHGELSVPRPVRESSPGQG